MAIKMFVVLRRTRAMPTTQKKTKPKMNFMTAAKKEGYMKKGSGFKPLPKRNSDAYNKIVRHMK